MSDALRFAPCPANIFEAHIREYYRRSRDACPTIEAICGKWRFEDLIPGMSDFDTRFIASDDTSPEDWASMSREIGRIHTAICREYPDRARILEHLPGINLTWSEVCDPLFYYPEFHQWTIYFGEEEKIAEFTGYLNGVAWNDADELFSLNKFLLYYTPYDRSIDPPINLHEFENKYPLHSRFMHYFCPPVQSAVSIMKKRMIRGKAESLRFARELFPNPGVIDMIFDALDRHYELPDWYREPRLTEIEDALFSYLTDVFHIIIPRITVVEAASGDSPQAVKEKCRGIETGSLTRFYEGVKFSRLMMGRLLFYAEDLPRFDSTWLIGHELRRIRRMFFETTFSAFARIAWKESITPEDALERCRGEFLDEADYRSVREFADIFAEGYTQTGMKKFAVKVAARMGAFQVVLEKMTALALSLEKKKNVK